MSNTLIKPLRQGVVELLDAAHVRCGSIPELSDLDRIIEQKRKTLDTPMRVAFVGRTSAGKSTMLNAFLGEHLAEMGTRELTNNVSWFKHGNSPDIRVHLAKGGIEKRSMEELKALSTHNSAHELSEKTQYLEFERPIEMLRKFDLIDTPGLHSFYETDSRKTKDLLLHEQTRPHALILLFAETLRQDDLDELDKFHEAAGSVMNGLTAIGGLNKVDVYETNGKGALEQGMRVIEQIATKHASAYRSMYSMLPVVGQAAFGGQILNSDDLEVLEEIAGLPEERLRKLTTVKEFFYKDYTDEPSLPSATARKALYDKLDLFGVRRAVEALREGVPPEALSAHLMRVSGVSRLRDLVVSHFGNRAFLIKTRATLGALRNLGFPLSQSLRGDGANAAREIVNLVDRILLNEPRFREFILLERHYAGNLDLGESEVQDLLLVTGERGYSCALRLGLEESAPMDRMLDAAQKRLNYWRAVQSDPFGAMVRRDSASILMDSYGHILNRLRSAAEHCKAAEELLAYES